MMKKIKKGTIFRSTNKLGYTHVYKYMGKKIYNNSIVRYVLQCAKGDCTITKYMEVEKEWFRQRKIEILVDEN